MRIAEHAVLNCGLHVLYLLKSCGQAHFLIISEIQEQISRMFVLTEMKDTVQVVPSLFDIDTNEAVIDALNKKLANKVISFHFHRIKLTLIMQNNFM